MCGLIGWWNREKVINHELFVHMRDTLAHRGPDGAGVYFSDKHKLALGHRRLSFIDLSENANQPLSNENNSIWISVNGEIYNYKELKQKLDSNHIFKSQSDSEVLLHAYEEWDTNIFSLIEGMFAIAIWDERKQKLILARDKFGIKPLYFYYDQDQVIFASEIKAILKNPEIKKDINFTSLCNYFTYRYVPSPETIFNNIYKLEPAHFIEFDNKLKIAKTEYFKFEISNNNIEFKDLVNSVDKILSKSVEIHIRSDVEIGSFLSGGYDSSAMLHYFSKFQKNINTFAIGFNNWDNSEHKFAEIVSKKYGSRHFNEILEENSFDILEKLMYYYDEPIADISIIPTYFVSKLAAKHNKAVLSGEGADEIFAGYSWHKKYLWNVSKQDLKNSKKWGWKLPINHYDLDSYSKAMAMGMFDHKELKTLLTPELHKFIPQDSFAFYRKYYNPELPMPKRFQLMDIKCFMAELVLTKVDRASMANSLEVRVPFLNTDLFNLLLKTNPSVYFDEKLQKPVLRKILKNKLPRKILNRKKQGFTGPDNYYMNFEKYQAILENSDLINDKIITKESIQKYFEDKDHWRLWKIAVLEVWYKKWMKNVL